MAESELECAFDTLRIQLLGDLPEPKREYKFNAPHTRHRFDFAWPLCKVACECEGGLFQKSRHRTGKGYHNDCIKYNLAIERGWKVLRYTELHLRNDPVAMFEQIRRVLESC